MNRTLRIAFALLLVAGVAVHLWISTQVGLAMVAVGLVAHLAAALAGRRWLARNRSR
ncbi:MULTISPECIES: hypothetical protein [Streptomyces]|uniref:hypothetical protein n=1 Tax=Streptomyces TaxID=1883 RepID=UPI001584E0B6|nr:MULTISPECIES: hypothetical protein [Streptomyces]WSA98615.1 hypothetical protein OIE54_04705 [Streptomyces sp. NBC_01794]NUK04482.1 hypothetical protein [Streptomyces lunaelactis]NUK07373.1 hypothetical protein [Streptomyces lunaelactis]NUK15754.1 hypothetical protein [Streptomyces lunaelactis]NUK22281.1 hypothetical protein [Streptomyces lunaelactis]